MKIAIEIPDDKVQGVVDAFCKMGSYKTKISREDGVEIDNPVTKAQFAKNLILSYIKQIYVDASVSDLEVQRQQTAQTAFSEISGMTIN